MSKACPRCSLEYDDALPACPRHSGTEESAPDPMLGRIIGDRYQVTDLLGKGAMGIVYRAVQTSDGKHVAIKVLHAHLASDQESIKRFHAEARAASSLMHANIVRIYDVGVLPTGSPYIAMELLNGKTLAEFLKEKQFCEPREALPIIRQVCEALAEAHSHGVLHRDIKPANIMLMNRFGIDNFVVVLDFSIAKVIQKVSDADSTTAGMILGSPAYMSPERFKGQGGDFRSEIYSMGIIMFQLLTGRPPFKSADLYSLMNEHVRSTPPTVKDIRPTADVSDNLEAIIARALAKQPEERQENMKQLLNQVSDEIYNFQTPVRQETVAPSLVSSTDTISSISPVQSSQSVSSSRTSRTAEAAAASTFDVNPGGVTPAFGMPVYNPAMRKLAEEHGRKLVDDHKVLPELSASGRWDRSLIVKGDRTRPVIRHRESSDARALKVTALAAVLLFGLVVLFFGLVARPNQNELSVQGLVSKGDLRNAALIVEQWHNSGVSKEDREQFARSCLQVAKAYQKKKELPAAAALYNMVPDKTQVANEARRNYEECTKSNEAE